MASALSINNIQPTYRGAPNFGYGGISQSTSLPYQGFGSDFDLINAQGYSNLLADSLDSSTIDSMYDSSSRYKMTMPKQNVPLANAGNGIDWLGYGQAGVGAVMGLGQAYNAFTSANVAKKQFELNRKVALANLEGSQQAYNNQLGIQANNMYSGYASERMAAGDNRTRQQYQEDYISQRGVGSRGLA